MRTRFALAGLLAIIACAAAPPVPAQRNEPAVLHRDPVNDVHLPPRLDVHIASYAIADTVHVERHLSPVLYVAALAAGTQLARFDRDPGGYDRWRFYGRKTLDHSLAGALLEGTAERARVRPALALSGTCLAAVGYEYAQGYPNAVDVFNGCGAATLSYLYGRYWR